MCSGGLTLAPPDAVLALRYLVPLVDSPSASRISQGSDQVSPLHSEELFHAGQSAAFGG